jgi:hypothetical protein
VHWINLQYDDVDQELTAVQQDWSVTIHRWEELDLWRDLDGVAALVAALDLVIVPVTTIASLAGGLGQPGWRLTVYDGEWDALGTGLSPWTPSLRVYRQPRPGDWQSVLHQIATDLAALVGPQATGKYDATH